MICRSLLLAPALAALLGGARLAQEAPPHAVRRALDAAYPGWRYATLGADVAPHVPGARQWVRGDFDRDGRADYAVQIVTAPAAAAGPPADSAQLVVAALSRRAPGRRVELVVVNAGPASGVTFLGLAQRGERIRDLDADPNGDSTYVLAHDGIHVFYAEAASETCRWVPGARPPRFLCRASSD